MAYQSRLAKLLLESEHVLHKRKQRDPTTNDEADVSSAAIDSMLEEVKEVMETSRTVENVEQAPQIQGLIEQGLLQRKKKKSKHDARHSTDGESMSLELFDWRARTL